MYARQRIPPSLNWTDVDIQTGDIEVIEKTTRPFPKVNDGDIVIKVRDNL